MRYTILMSSALVGAILIAIFAPGGWKGLCIPWFFGLGFWALSQDLEP